MPSQKYALEPNGPKRLEVSWSGFWKNIAVAFDGAQVGALTKEELNAGKDLRLPDGSTFRVHLKRVGLGQELQCTRNGAPLPGSASDPKSLVKTAAFILYFLAAINSVLGVVALVGHVEVLLNLGLGVSSILVGVVYAVLGFFTMQRSRIALGVAMALYVLDAIVTMAMSVEAGGSPGAGGIVMRVIFIMAMWRAFKAMGAQTA